MTGGSANAVRCLSCGEDVLGMANRCWKCHGSLGTHDDGRPRLRRRPVPAEWLGLAAAASCGETPHRESDSAAASDEASDDGAASAPQTASPFAFVAETARQPSSVGELSQGGKVLSDEGRLSESAWWWTGIFVALALAVAVGGPWPGWGWMLAAATVALAVVALRSRRAQGALVVLLLASMLLAFHSARLAGRMASWIRISAGSAVSPTGSNAPVDLDPDS